jgi:hypothetical protein
VKQTPLERRTPLRRGRGLARGGRLKPMSQNTRERIPERQVVREEAIRRAGGRCQMRDVVPEVRCWGDLEVDEVCSRGVNPGGQYDVDNTQVACSAHHQWRTREPEEARKRGLRLESWERPQ